MLNETPNVVVQISSHTDTRGKADYNLKLSAERAKSVVDYLVSKGVDRSRLIAKGYGESRPVIANAKTEDEHQANRRTTFKVIDVNHKGKIVADTEKGTVTKQGHTVTDLVYHIQLVTTSRKLDINKDFGKLKRKIPELKIFVKPYGKLFKYEAGETMSLSDAKVLRNIIKKSGYKDCFIVPYYKNRKISVQEAETLEKGGSL
jgi:phosphoribosyl-ATP pyrophosphohydrolase